MLGLRVKRPYVEKEVRRELAQAGLYTQSGRAFRPDCARIARLEPACTDAVRWWKQQQADAPGCARCCFSSVGQHPLGRSADDGDLIIGYELLGQGVPPAPLASRFNDHGRVPSSGIPRVYHRPLWTGLALSNPV